MAINLNTEPETNLGDKLLGWDFPEFRMVERTRTWWVIAALLTAGVLYYSYLEKNYLFAVIVIFVISTIWIDSRRQPNQLEFSIYQEGVVVSSRLWTWKELDFFWIAYRPPHVNSIYIQPKNIIQPRISVPLAKTNPLKIREVLSKFLREDLDKEDEPTSEALSRLLKIQ